MPPNPDWRYQPAEDLLAGRVILVTGAGDGIGKIASLTYARFGADVVLLGRTRAKLETVFDEIQQHTQTKAVIVPCDLAALDADAADALGQSIQADYGRLDGILHNASILGPRVPIAHYPIDDWIAVMQVNTIAPLVLTQRLLPLLDAADDASIIYTSSGVGTRGRAYWGAYSVSKFALEGLSQIVADEHASSGRIRANTLNPGATRTAMRAQAYPQEDAMTLPTADAHMDLYLYLMGPESRRITGQQFDAKNWSGPSDS